MKSDPVHFRFGPLSFSILHPGPIHDLLRPFATKRPARSTKIEIIDRPGPVGPLDSTRVEHQAKTDQILGPGFGALIDPMRPMGRAWILRDMGAPGFPLLSLLCGLTAYQAARHKLALLHAGGLRVPGGALLVAGASGVGKSTLVQGQPERAFAYNAVIVDPRTRWTWPLPFTGRRDPPIRRAGRAKAVGLVVLHRSGPLGLRPLDRPIAVLPHVVTLAGDRLGIESVAAALAFLRKVPLRHGHIPASKGAQAMIDCLARFAWDRVEP